MSIEATALLLAWVTIVLLAFAMAGILRQVQSLRLLVRGSSPKFGPALGSKVVLQDLGANASHQERQFQVVLYADTECEACKTVLPELARESEKAPTLSFKAVFAESAHGLNGTAVQVIEHARASFDQLGIRVTPTAIALSPNGTVLDVRPVGAPGLLREFCRSVKERSVRNDSVAS